MASRAKVRDYNHPDGHLAQLADSFCIMAERDATDLLDYGFTITDLAAIRAARAAFQNFPEDIEFSAPLLSNTQLRDSLVPQLSTALRQICIRAQLAYGAQSSQYRPFALGSISNYSPEQLLRASTHVCSLATAQLPQLAAQGLTPAIIADTQAIATELDTCLTDRFTLAINRETATVRRIELGNALYALLVTLSGKGKLCYHDTTSSKHRHYQISE